MLLRPAGLLVAKAMPFTVTAGALAPRFWASKMVPVLRTSLSPLILPCVYVTAPKDERGNRADNKAPRHAAAHDFRKREAFVAIFVYRV